VIESLPTDLYSNLTMINQLAIREILTLLEAQRQWDWLIASSFIW